jgi:hypothetical protein
MLFEFATARRVIFGPGTSRQAGALARKAGRRALVVTGRDSARAQFLLDSLRENGVSAVVFAVAGEPSIDTVRQGVELGLRENCDLVVSLGGGSALDTGKAIAAMLTNPGDVLDYLEVIGGGKALVEPSAPFIAIPTTAGTGSEVTRNAVLASPEHRQKVSLRSPSMLPSVAIIDPELTWGVPPAMTASTGMDALTQLIEPYVCNRPNPMTDALCVEGMRGRLARCASRLKMAGKRRRARTWRWRVFLEGWRWPTPVWGPCMVLPGPSAGCSTQPHGRFARPCCRTSWRRTCARFASANRATTRCAATRKSAFGDGQACGQCRRRRGLGAQLVRDLRIPSLGSYGMAQADMGRS